MCVSFLSNGFAKRAAREPGRQKRSAAGKCKAGFCFIPLRGGRVNSCAQNLRFRYIFGRAVRYNKSSTGFGSEPDILQMDCMEAKEYAQRRIWRPGWSRRSGRIWRARWSGRVWRRPRRPAAGWIFWSAVSAGSAPAPAARRRVGPAPALPARLLRVLFARAHGGRRGHCGADRTAGVSEPHVPHKKVLSNALRQDFLFF